MKHSRHFILIAALLGFSLFCNAQTEQLITTLRSGLSHASSPQDSLKILYDVYDASKQADKKNVGEEILAIAGRTGNEAALAEFIPQMSILHMHDDEKMQHLLTLAEKISDTNQRKGVKLFINVYRALNEATYLPEAERERALLKYVQDDMRYSDDLYQNILDLSRVVIFLGQSSQSSMYVEYLTRLDSMLDQLPESCYYIRNLFYTTAANTYSANDNYVKAIEADRKLLEIIKQLQKKYKERGRKYRNYDRYIYQCYRRMLRSYPALSQEEVEQIYAKCAMLAEKNEEVAKDFYTKSYPTAYRLMAAKDYAAAIPHLKKALANTSNRILRKSLLKMTVEAADSVGDDETLLMALKEYNTTLENQINRHNEESFRELTLRHDIDRLKSEKNKLALEKKDVEVMTGHKVITLILVALLVLAIVVMLLYRRHYVLRQHLRDVRLRNNALSAQIQEMLSDGHPAGSVPLHKHHTD